MKLATLIPATANCGIKVATIIGAGGVAALIAVLSLPHQVTWSDAQAETRLAPPKLKVDIAALADDRLALNGQLVTAPTTVDAPGEASVS